MAKTLIPVSLTIIAVVGAIFFIVTGDGVSASEGREFSTSIERSLSQSQDSSEALSDVAKSDVFQGMFGLGGRGNALQGSSDTSDGEGTPEPTATLTPEQKLDLQAAELQTGAPTQLQIDVREVQDQWSVRYQAAKEEVELLSLRVDATSKYAGDYFDIQNDRINDIQVSQPGGAELRSNLSRVLRAQMTLYDNWFAQAERIRDQMDVIMAQLDNMNLTIEFMSDAADFDAIAKVGLETPRNIVALQDELPRFQQMTVELADRLESQE